MKNFLISVFAFFTSQVIAQHSIFLESGVNKISSNNHFGYQYFPDHNKVGLYFTIGGNVFEKLSGTNNLMITGSDDSFVSTVPWLTSNGCYYTVLPPDEIFTSPQWGNQLLETGSYVMTLDTWFGDLTTITKTYNFGLSFRNPKKNHIRYRVGLGVNNLQQYGKVDYDYWEYSSVAHKYYDQWGVIADPSHIFVVVFDGQVREWSKTEYTSINITKINLNLALEMGLISIGYNSTGGINLGFGYQF
jgi:hypothetical protein